MPTLLRDLQESNPVVFHQFVFITVPGYLDTLMMSDDCITPDNALVPLTEYLYTPCEDVKGTIVTRCLQYGYNTYLQRPNYQCQMHLPAPSRTFVEATFSVHNLYVSEFYCGTKMDLNRLALREFSYVYYLKVYNFVESKIEDNPVTTFSVIIEIDSNVDQYIEELRNLEEAIQDYFASKTNNLYKGVYVLLNNDSVSTITASHGRRYLRA